MGFRLPFRTPPLDWATPACLGAAGERSGAPMRILGLAGLVLGLALIGYLVVAYLNEGTGIQATLDGGTTPLGGEPAAGPRDLTHRGLQQRLAPILDRAKERAEPTDLATEN